MAQNQDVQIKATVSVNSQGVDQYNKKLDDTAEKTEKAFNPKQALREANLALIDAQQKFGVYSKEAVAAAKRVAELKDQIQDAKEAADLFDPGRKFAAYSNALQSAAGVFAGVQGALGLIGVESDKVQEQLLKVQSALALSEGLSTIGDIGKNFGELSTIIKTQAVGAFNALKAAIGSTGIGLLVIALGAIVAYWDDIKAAVTGVDQKQQDALKTAKEIADVEQKKLEELDAQDNVLKLQGKSEREILKSKIDQIGKVIALRKAEVEKQKDVIKGQVEAEKRNNTFLKNVLRASIEAGLVPLRILAAPIDLLLATVNKVAETLGFAKIATVGLNEQISKLAEKGTQQLANFVFDSAKVEAEGKAAIEAAEKNIRDLTNKQAGYQLQIQQIDKQAADKRAADAKVAQEKENARRLEEEAKFLEKLSKLKQKADEAALNTTKNIVDGQKQFLKTTLDNNINAINANIEAIGKVSKEANAKQDEINKNNEERAKNALKWEDEKRKSYKMTGEALGALSDVIGKETAAGKALAVSQALINTYLGITEVLKNDTIIPEPFGTIQKIASVATIAASGFSAVRNITRTKVPGAAGGASASVPSAQSLTGGAAAPIAPQAPQAQTATLDQQSINQLGNVTARAYVVESDVSNSQERINRINRAARFG